MFPFGHSSILTVDLGQQYIDMFAGFKQTITRDPAQLFYSFSKNFGGEMFSEWAYYLLSPLNLIFLFFKQTDLTAAILFVTALRFGLAGLSMQLLLVKKNFAGKKMALIFSTSYALNGWMIANQVNLLWQDQIILLPLIIYALTQCFDEKKYKALILLFSLSIIDNFYIAYMIGLFLPLFAFWYLARTNEKKWTKKLIEYFQFLASLALSVLISAFVLIPTAFQLLNGKGQDTVRSIDWSFAANSVDLLLKLIPGSFDFDQMKTGQANFFIPFLMVIGVFAFICSKKEKIISKISAVLIIAIYLLSFTWQPLNILFHMMQYPVWYPYRYSFILCFFIILLAAIGLKNSQKHTLTVLSLSTILMIIISFSGLFLDKKTSFISLPQIILFIVLSIASLSVYMIYKNSNSGKTIFSFFMIVLVSTAANLFIATNNFSYLTQDEYRRTVKSLENSTDFLPKKSFYRIGQTFSRTRGDPFANGFAGGMHFSSTVDKATPNLFGSFGQAAGDYYTAYSYGTIMTDSLFAMKYFVAPSPAGSNEAGSPKRMADSYRPDLSDYKLIRKRVDTQTYENPYALPIAFLADNKVFDSRIYPQNPIMTSANLLENISDQSSLIEPSLPFDINTLNIKQNGQFEGFTAEKIDGQRDAAINITFTPNNNDSYYLTIPSSFNQENVWITINGQVIPQSPDQRDVVALNVANHERGAKKEISIHLRKTSLFVSNLQLYSISHQKMKQISDIVKKNRLKSFSWSQTNFSGRINADHKGQVLMTTIPDSPGWHLKINGIKQKKKIVDQYFIAASLKKGTNTVKIYYQEPYLEEALIISLFTLLIVLSFKRLSLSRKR